MISLPHAYAFEVVRFLSLRLQGSFIIRIVLSLTASLHGMMCATAAVLLLLHHLTPNKSAQQY